MNKPPISPRGSPVKMLKSVSRFVMVPRGTTCDDAIGCLCVSLDDSLDCDLASDETPDERDSEAAALYVLASTLQRMS